MLGYPHRLFAPAEGALQRFGRRLGEFGRAQGPVRYGYDNGRDSSASSSRQPREDIERQPDRAKIAESRAPFNGRAIPAAAPACPTAAKTGRKELKSRKGRAIKATL
jgi:hypothetical protein